jgi:hypothetical protein
VSIGKCYTLRIVRLVRQHRETGVCRAEEFLVQMDRWVPHISLVFREMWDTTALPSPLVGSVDALGFHEPCNGEGLKFAVSYISRKTSEIWCTQDYFVRRNRSSNFSTCL